MRAPSILLFLFLVVTLSFLIQNVGAQDDGTDLDLANFPEALGNYLNISTFAGGILASVLICFMFILPVAIWSKSPYPPIVVGLLCLGFSVSVNWLDEWFLLVTCLIIALMFSGKARTLISGGSGGD